MENSTESLHTVPTQQSLQSNKSDNANDDDDDDANITRNNSSSSLNRTDEFPQHQETNNIIRISKKPIRYLVINFNLINWNYMNLSMKFSDETYVFKIKEMLRQRHGCTDELKICMNAYADENEIRNEMLTLKDIGLVGKEPTNLTVGSDGQTKFDESELPNYHFFYDFKPSAQMDPLLLY